MHTDTHHVLAPHYAAPELPNGKPDMSGDSEQADDSTRVFDALENARLEYERAVLSQTQRYQSNRTHHQAEDLIGQTISASSLHLS